MSAVRNPSAVRPALWPAIVLMMVAACGWSQALAQTPSPPAPSAPPAPTAPTTGVTAAEPPSSAARAVAVQGTVFITRADGRRSTLAEGSALQTGDTLNTTRNSTVRVRFTDGGETLLRPESAMQVQAYRFDAERPEADSLVLRLVRGGLRAITGQISKRGNVDAYRLNINTATVGIRGTDYSARLCANDCDTAGASTPSTPAQPAATTPSPRSNSAAPVVARVVLQQGQINVLRESLERPLAPGAALYAGDRLSSTSGAHAVLAFRDNTRVTLNPASAIELTEYSFNPAQPDASNFLMRLVRGGLRVATGLIGKDNPRQFKVQTPTSTVGIRGTVFDLVCGDTHSSGAQPPPALSETECDRSLYALTRQGEIGLTAEGSSAPELPVAAERAGVAADANGSTQLLEGVPDYFLRQTTPQPEAVPVDIEQLFGAAPPDNDTGGIFLLVRDGRVTLAQASAEVTLEAGESAYAGPLGVPQRLISSPAVLDRDPFLSDRLFNNNMCRR